MSCAGPAATLGNGRSWTWHTITADSRPAEPSTQATRIVLRPIANPLPLGFLALGVATLILSALQLNWVPATEGHHVAIILLAFVAPLQLVASIFGFLARDAVAGTGMGVLAGTWLSISLVMWSATPGSNSKALGLLLLVASMSMTAPAIASSMGKLVATAVLATTSLRFAVTGVYQLTGSSSWKHAAGFIGLALFSSSGHSKTVASATVGGTFTSVGASVSGSGTTEASTTAGGSVTPIGVSAAGTGKAVVRDACSLLTTAELEGALGGTVAGGSLTTAPGSNETICEWTITPSSGDGFGVELRTSPGSVADFNQRRQAASGPTVDVAGVGDQAYSERYVNGSLVFDDLWVRKGAESFRLEVLNDMGSKPLVQLAQAVITRL